MKIFQKQFAFLFGFSLICLIAKAQQPVISSFSPASGPIGTTVTITGTNFSSISTSNIVFFGAVRANVTAASATALSVTVPAGATHEPIRVTVNNLTAWSSRLFNVTFSGGTLSTESFVFEYELDNVTGIETNDLVSADFDNDGRNDIAIADRINNYMAVYRNVSQVTHFRFDSRLTFFTGNQPRAIASGDFNGDGKPDIVVANTNSNTVSVYRNTSTFATISFAAKVDFATAIQPLDVAVADFDGDGNADIATANGGSSPSVVSILRNTGTGTIAFAPKTDISILLPASSIAVGDLNADNKPDIGVVSIGGNFMFVATNNSTPGSISFPVVANFASGTGPGGITIGDIDGDLKPDITYANFFDGTLYVYRNTTSATTITLSTPQNISLPGADETALADADGDGKPDLIVQTFSPSGFSVLKNNSNPGTITLGSPISYNATCGNGVLIGDWNNDGKCDVALGCGVSRVGIWKNKTTEPAIIGFTPATAAVGTTVTISGANLAGVTSVSFGGIAAASFTVVNSATISAVVGTGASGNVAVSGTNGLGEKSGFIFMGPPVITSFTPASGSNGAKITINGKNFVGTTAVSFGGRPASSFVIVNPDKIEAYVGDGATGEVSITNAYGIGSAPGFTYTPIPIIDNFTPWAAGPGATVTITGKRFIGITSVSFGGIPASSFNVVNSNTINAVVGTGASGNVIVANTFGSDTEPGFVFIPAPVISSFTPVTAGSGTTVTINGDNFVGVSSVKFGDFNAFFPVEVINAQTIKAVVYNGGSGSVSVTTAGGTGFLPGFTFVPAPTITNFTPATIGSGTLVTITGTNFSNASSVTFGGIQAASFTVVSPTTITALVNNAISGNVVVTTLGGVASISGFSFVNATPVINKISPLSGPVGTEVLISGANFDLIKENNIVYFGAVKAKVLSATSNLLRIRVPAGITNNPITVTTLPNARTASSDLTFKITFPDDPNAFNINSFAGRMDLAAGKLVGNVEIGDLDNDSKPDIVVSHFNSPFVSIFKNNSVIGQLLFSQRVDINMGSFVSDCVLYDINGDGKLDMVLTKYNNLVSIKTAIYILINTSSPGSISFAAPITLTSSNFLPVIQYIAVGDLNNDGKPEIAGINTNTGYPTGFISFEIFKNNSTLNNISFISSLASAQVGANPNGSFFNGIEIRDLNSDSRPEILLGVWEGNTGLEKVVILGNQTMPGNTSYSFTPSILNNFYITRNIFADDINLDGRIDFLTGEKLVLNNGNLNFSVVITNLGGNSISSDLNGDSKPDIISYGLVSGNTNLTVRKNSLPGVLYGSPQQYSSIGNLFNAGDLDGDGKPEICSNGPASISIFRNRIGELPLPPPAITSFTPSTGTFLTPITITGSNFSQATAVSFGGITAENFNVVSPTQILAYAGNGATGDVMVTTPGGTTSMQGFTYLLLSAPGITSFTPLSAVKGTQVTIIGSNFNNVQLVSFGNMPAESYTVVNSSTIIAIVGEGATGQVKVETPGGTATLSGFTFNNIPTSVSDPVISNSNLLTVFPNPAGDEIWIKCPLSARAQINIVDITGRVIKNLNLNSSAVPVQLNIQKLPKGIYNILWTDGKKRLLRTFTKR